MNRISRVSLYAALFALFAPPAYAAGYPERPIRVIIPFSPGGGTDILTRLLQPRLEKAFGTQILIDNRTGAGGTIGVTAAARADPDGYSLLVTSASFTFAPGIYKKDLPYDAIKDFQPLTMLTEQPLLLCVHPSLPVKNVKELIALAKKRPKEIFHGNAGYGSNLHMTHELFKYLAKINMTAVQYKGGGPVLIALVSGEVQVSFLGVASSKHFRQSGQLRAIAVSTAKRIPLLPDLPTISESGVPKFIKGAWTGMFVQAAVPKPIVNHIYKAVAAVVKDPDAVKRLAEDGWRADGRTPEEFTKFIHAEIEEWSKLASEMNL
jgi:tripartite-type tricarboxylate transporter receptor subunit TctC